MMAAGSHWVICRPIRRLSGCLCPTSVVRAFGWLMAILAFTAIGLVYTGFHSQEGPNGSFISLKHVTRTYHTHRTAEGHKIPGDAIQSLQDIISRKKEVLEDAESLSAIDRSSVPGVQGTSVNSRAAETRGVGEVGGSVNLDLKDILRAAAQKQNFEEGTAGFGRIGASTNESITTGGELAKRFECPSNFTMTDPDNVWFQSSIVQKSSKYDVTDDVIAPADDVIILTPVSNVKRHLWKYFQNVCSLTYPHRHISVILGEDSSSDQTFETAEKMAALLRPYFKRVEVLHLKGSSSQTSGQARHDRTWQLTRRRHLAMARNQLMFAALGGGSEKWVLWMDSDVRHIPADLVERMIWPQKGIVAANCLYRQDTGQTDTFDRNTWRDTETSKQHLQRMPEDFLMLEGYDQTERKYLNDLKGEGDLVRLDGVGGCALFVEADLHRKGLVFPAFVFDHHVETEGMAKMAARLGVGMFGLPSVNVIHW